VSALLGRRTEWSVSRGVSDEAAITDREASRGQERLRESHTFGDGRRRALAALEHVRATCGSPGWDGARAAPVAEITYLLALRLLDSLPLGLPVPTVSAEPDGHVTLEWHRSASRTLSVSVSPDAELHYAAQLDDSTQYGTEPFFAEVPGRIAELIVRVSPHADG
jgi:hypothetical protein